MNHQNVNQPTQQPQVNQSPDVKHQAHTPQPGHFPNGNNIQQRQMAHMLMNRPNQASPQPIPTQHHGSPNVSGVLTPNMHPPQHSQPSVGMPNGQMGGNPTPQHQQPQIPVPQPNLPPVPPYPDKARFLETIGRMINQPLSRLFQFEGGSVDPYALHFEVMTRGGSESVCPTPNALTHY